MTHWMPVPRALKTTLLVGLLAIAPLGIAPLTAAEPGDVVSFYRADGSDWEWQISEEYVAVVYPDSVRASDAVRMGREDAATLGVEVALSALGRNEVIVKGTQKEIEGLIANRSAVAQRVQEVRPVYFPRGVPALEAAMTIPDRLVISFEDGVGIDKRDEVLSQYGLTIFKKIFGNTYSVHVSEKTANAEIIPLCAQIIDEHQGVVRSTEPAMNMTMKLHGSTALPLGDPEQDLTVPSGADPLFDLQWHLNNRSQNTEPTEFRGLGIIDEDVDAPRFWNPNVRGDEFGDGREFGYFGDSLIAGPIVVGVFDSGTDLNHEDWAINTDDDFLNPTSTRTVLDSRLGFDYFEVDPEPRANNEPHGTAVAGIIAAARNNGVGVVGVAPAAKIYTARIFGDIDEGGTTSDLVALAVIEASEQQVDIGNHSWGYSFGVPGIVVQAFDLAYESGRFGRGMANIVSSSNDSDYMTYPALLDSTYSVGGVDDQGQLVSYASWGGKLDFVGPTQQQLEVVTGGGQNPEDSLTFRPRSGIVTTDIEGPAGYTSPNPLNELDPFGNYTLTFNGTSASAPVITGTAALILSQYPDLTAFPAEADLKGQGYGAIGQLSLLEVMAMSADRPPNQYTYFAEPNEAANMVFIGTGEEPGTTEVLRRSVGNPAGFRNNGNFAVDGFHHFYGYGRPNPFRAAVQRYAPSPLRDYTSPGGTESNPLDDFGELVLLYDSDFAGDYYAIIEECLLELTPDPPAGRQEDPAEPEPLTLETVDCLELEACLLSKNIDTGALDFEPVGDWGFSPVRAVDPEDASEIGPQELHFWPAAFSNYLQNVGGSQVEQQFEFGDRAVFDYINPFFSEGDETHPVATDLVGAFAPVLITSSRPPSFCEEIGADDFRFNPRERYLAEAFYEVKAEEIEIPQEYVGQPIILEVSLAYELARGEASEYDGVEGNRLDPRERERIDFSVNNVIVGTITGDSHNEQIFPLIPGAERDPGEDDDFGTGDDFALWTQFEGAAGGYFPELEKPRLTYRTFRFGPIIADSEFVSVAIRMSQAWESASGGLVATNSTGNSYLPEWEIDENGEATQIVPHPKRDLRGFRLADVKLWASDLQPDPNTGLSGEDIFNPASILLDTAGAHPLVSPRGNEVFYAAPDENGVLSNLNVVDTQVLSRRRGTTSAPIVERQEPVTLLTACADEHGVPGPCPETAPILSLDVRTNDPTLLYVAERAPGEPRIYFVSDDGFDERNLFEDDPRFVGGRADALTTEATYAQESDVVFFTDGVFIEATDFDGEDIEFIFDGNSVQPDAAGSTLTKLRDIASIDSAFDDAMVFFTARNPNNDYNVYATNRAINTPGLPSRANVQLVWPQSVERNLTVSPNSERFAFESNALSVGGGSQVPPETAPYRIWLLDNFNAVVNFGADPEYTPIDPIRDTRLLPPGVNQSDRYASARFPRFTADSNGLAFVGLLQGGAFNQGEIALTRISAREPFVPVLPPPAPFPTPVPPGPAPTPEPEDSIVNVSQYEFDATADGWRFNPGGFTDPQARVVDGKLLLQASDNNDNTYGYFGSPAHALRLFPFDVMNDPSVQGVPFEERQGPLYLMRFFVQRTTPDALQAPTLRMRVNSYGLEDYHNLLIMSWGDAHRTPSADEFSPVDMLFQPPPYMYTLPNSQQSYYLNFDLLNFYTVDDPNGGYLLDRVEIYRVPTAAIENLGTFREYDFSTPAQRADWDTYQYQEYEDPELAFGANRLEMWLPETNGAHGHWQTDADAVGVSPLGLDGKLYVRMTMRAGSEIESPFKVPQMRFRMSQQDFTATSLQGVFGLSTGTFVPTIDNGERVYRTYLEIPSGWDDIFRVLGSWDILSFEQYPQEYYTLRAECISDLGGNVLAISEQDLADCIESKIEAAVSTSCGADTACANELRSAIRLAIDNDASSKKVYLDHVEFELLRIRGYPAAVPLP